MMDWDDLRFFLNAVRAGNYTAAAERLEVNRTTVGRRVTALEQSLGVSLFELTPMGYRPTPAGRAVLETAQRVEREIAGLVGPMTALGERPSGTVRLAVSAELDTEFMAELMGFRAAYPEVRLEFPAAQDAMASVLQRKADLGLCPIAHKPDELTGLRVGGLTRALYAARDYLERLPPDMALGDHQWVGWGKELAGTAPARWMKQTLPETAAISAEVNSWTGMKEAVLCGFGIGPLWCFVADRDKRLQRLRPPDPALALDLWLLVREDVPPDACTAALMQFLVPALARRIEG